MTDRVVYYQKSDVTITDREAIFGEKVYPLSEITSVTVGNKSILFGTAIMVVGLLWLAFSLRWVAGIGEMSANNQTTYPGLHLLSLNFSTPADVFTFFWEIVISPLIGMYIIGYGITRIWIAKETHLIQMTSLSGVKTNQAFYNSDELERVVEALRRAINQPKE